MLAAETSEKDVQTEAHETTLGSLDVARLLASAADEPVLDAVLLELGQLVGAVLASLALVAHDGSQTAAGTSDRCDRDGLDETQLFDEAKTVNRSRRGFGLGEFDVLLFVSEEDLDLVLRWSDRKV